MTTTFAPESKVAPGPTSWLPGGNFLKFRRDPLTFFTDIQRTFGDFEFRKFRLYLWGAAYEFLARNLDCYRLTLYKPKDA